MGRGRWVWVGVLVIAAMVAAVRFSSGLRMRAVRAMGWGELPGVERALLHPEFHGPDQQRRQVAVRLEPVAEGFIAPTDIQFAPGLPTVMFVAQKQGHCEWVDLARNSRGTLFHLDVPDLGESGLLGLAFHPGFATNKLLYVHHNTWREGGTGTRVGEWTVELRDGLPVSATQKRVVLEFDQPHENHNGGQLAFGSDGMLYLGLGDGGRPGDPDGNSQNLETLLGKVLRVDVDHPSDGRGYTIPPDNPFVGDAKARGEIWVYGVRNPWRFSVLDAGGVLVADVGFEKWDELSFARRGDNLGWNRREADACFKPPADGASCEDASMREPFYVYGRDDGQSIIGGVMVTGGAIAELRGKYVFGDAWRGRLWALTLPAFGEGPTARLDNADTLALGHFPIMPVTFALDADGNVLVADLGHGVVYRVVPGKDEQP